MNTAVPAFSATNGTSSIEKLPIVASSSMIVTRPTELAKVAFVGALKTMKSVSFCSMTASSTIVTVTGWTVVPGLKVSVPEVAV